MLEQLYADHGVTDAFEQGKKVLLVCPSKDHDIKPFLSWSVMDRSEVAVTWPKGKTPEASLDIAVAEAGTHTGLTVQVDVKVSRKLPFWSAVEQSQNLRAKVDAARGLVFVNLHHHDEFSVRDGLGSVDHLIAVQKARKNPFVCITNHGSVGGWIKQYGRCKKDGVKAIFGCEMYFQDYRGDDPELRKLNRKNFHLVLLAKTHEGYKNIIRIHNDAQLDGYYYMPRVNHEALKKWGKGICGLSACMQGELSQALMDNDEPKAMAAYERLKGSLEEFYIELVMINMAEQVEANRRLVAFAQKVGAKLVVTNDSHYIYPEYKDTHDLLLLIRQHKTVNDKVENPEEVWQFGNFSLHVRDDEDMRRLFTEMYKDATFTDEVFEEAMLNTRRIACSCEPIKLDSTFKLPKLYPDAEKVLHERAWEGLSRRGLKGAVGYNARLERELEVICKMGFADYFLIVERIVNDTKDKYGEWAVGWGRGSAGGSLVSYSLRITDIDPLKFGLLFERFMDEGRKDDCPDIDLDFRPDIRPWVKEHIVEVFGEKQTCSIGTYQTYKTKAVLLDVARSMGLDVSELQQITRVMDGLATFEVEDSEEEQKIDQMDFDEIIKHYPLLAEYLKKYPDVRRHSEVLRFQVKNTGKHAGGMIISNLNVQDEIPVFRDKTADQIVSAWSEGQATHELSAVGLIKFDILGLNNLTIIQDCCNYIESNQGVRLKKSDVRINDKESIKNSSRDDMVGIFQFEHPSTKPIADAVGMDSVDDIAAVSSLLRPGPRDMKMDVEYAMRKSGKAPFEIMPCLQPVIGHTYGILVYQEQTMRIAQALCGFSAVDSNKLRKVLIKEKNQEVLEKMRLKFIEGAQPRVDKGELTKEAVEKWWDYCKSFSGYGFCAAHAYEYAAVSAAEFYLKYNFPTEYLAALINSADTSAKPGVKPDSVRYINYARKRGTPVLLPDVNRSGANFRIEAKTKIRFGLSSVKFVGSVAGLVEEKAPYKDIEDFYRRSHKKVLNRRVFTSLVMSGAFDDLAGSPDTYTGRQYAMDKFFALRKKYGEDKKAMEREEKAQKAIAEGKKPRVSKKPLKELELEEFKPMSVTEWQKAETETIGICLSRTPLRVQWEDRIREKRFCTIDEAPYRKMTFVFGRVESIVSRISKKGNAMKVVTLSDDIDEMTFFVFSKGQMKFDKQVRRGMVVAVPLDIFEDSPTRFFNQMKDVIVLQK